MDPDPVFDVCDCPRAPVMWWLLPTGAWVAAYEFTGQRDIGADAAMAREKQVAAFQVSCPACGRVYLRAVT